MNHDLKKQLADLIDQAYQRGKQDGLSTGYSFAQRIVANVKVNPKLIKPYSEEALFRVIDDDLADLKSMLS